MSDATPISHPDHQDTYWKSLHYFNAYRLIVAGILLGTYYATWGHFSWVNYNDKLYLTTSIAYLCFAVLSAAASPLLRPRFNRLLSLQVIGDIIFIAMLMYASGGVRSGLGLLLVVVITAASLVSQGRLALFYASVATIAMLLEQSYQYLTMGNQYEDYSHVVMLGLSYFATAWLAHSFADRVRRSEELASQRGIDLQNLALVNQLVIREMEDGILVVDKDFKLRHFNNQAERLLRKPALAWKETSLDNYSSEITEPLRAWVNGSHSGAVITKIGGQELRLRFLQVGIDKKQGAVVFIEDWSRVQNQAQQIKLASLGRLTASIAHEIRNPLSAIGHAGQLLQEDEQTDNTARRLLQIIQDNVQRVDEIVRDVLQLNRRDRAETEVISAVAFLREFAGQFCQIENVPQGSIKLQLPPDETRISFDRRHLDQVLWNLCRNGWRHGTKQLGSLRLHLQELPEDALTAIDIIDNGEGVPEDIRPHLFEPFFTTDAGGTGLGLYIARELCDANGATLEYIWAPKGAWFRIYAKKYDD